MQCDVHDNWVYFQLISKNSWRSTWRTIRRWKLCVRLNARDWFGPDYSALDMRKRRLLHSSIRIVNARKVIYMVCAKNIELIGFRLVGAVAWSDCSRPDYCSLSGYWRYWWYYFGIQLEGFWGRQCWRFWLEPTGVFFFAIFRLNSDGKPALHKTAKNTY